MSTRRARTRIMLGAGLALFAAGGVGLATTLTAHADQSGTSRFGGYSITATAPGVEGTEDEPSAQAHPEGQGAAPETSSLLSSGPVGYALSTHYQSRGVMTDALQILLDDLFQNTLLERIEARCAVENYGSQRVLEKNGFAREGRLKGYFKLRGRRVDNFLYGLLRDDYLAQRRG